MKTDFERSLLESGELIRSSISALAGNIGRVIAVITLFISALVLFTDIGFRDFGTESFTSTLAVMLLASYVMYFSMSDSGEVRAESTEEYKSAEKKYTELSAKITGDMIPALRNFCKRYSEKELEYRRSALILGHGYSENEYLAYKNGDKFDKRARRTFRRALRLKAIEISPKVLLSKVQTSKKSELVNPQTHKLVMMIVKLIPMTLCMTLTVSVMLTAKKDLDAAGVVDGIFKLSSLPVVGFKGYASGYSYSKKTLPVWLQTKSRLLEAFLSEFKEK